MNTAQLRRDATGSGERVIADMILAARALADHDQDELDDGWRRPLRTSPGFRYTYKDDIGAGGWEFHYLTEALSLAVVDFTAVRSISHLHRNDGHLVFSAVLEGRSVIQADDLRADQLASGFCTVTSLAKGAAAQTTYEAGRPMRWISVFLRRDKTPELFGFDPSRLPEIIRDDLMNHVPLGLRSVPLTSATSMAATQIFDCKYRGEVRRLYLIAKAIEIICAVIGVFDKSGDTSDAAAFTDADAEKARVARAIIEENLDEPLSVPELSRIVGLSKQKLQLGFRLLFNTSVGRLYRQVRLAKAVTLVSDTRLSMIEIAFECGYEHPGSFSRAFKSAFGASPIDVRNTAKRKT